MGRYLSCKWKVEIKQAFILFLRYYTQMYGICESIYHKSIVLDRVLFQLVYIICT